MQELNSSAESEIISHCVGGERHSLAHGDIETSTFCIVFLGRGHGVVGGMVAAGRDYAKAVEETGRNQHRLGSHRPPSGPDVRRAWCRPEVAHHFRSQWRICGVLGAASAQGQSGPSGGGLGLDGPEPRNATHSNPVFVASREVTLCVGRQRVSYQK